MTKKFVLVMLFVVLISCKERKQNTIIGLWEVEKVQLGEEEITPNARWMRFNKDSTQVSGNGWLQHSIGTWKLKEGELTVNNVNGIKDEAQPFKVEVHTNTMHWSRMEEGQNLKVYLKRIKELPASEGNKILGLWKLESIHLGEGENNKMKVDPKSTLFLRWDNTYVKEGTLIQKEYGVYKVHGHKPELQMVNYGMNPEFRFYKFQISQNKLRLKATDGTEELYYTRIHQFLQ